MFHALDYCLPSHLTRKLILPGQSLELLPAEDQDLPRLHSMHVCQTVIGQEQDTDAVAFPGLYITYDLTALVGIGLAHLEGTRKGEKNHPGRVPIPEEQLIACEGTKLPIAA